MKRSTGRFACMTTLLLVTVLLLAGLSGCGQSSVGGNLTDDAGNKLNFNKPVKRVVSLVPANTEIIYALGGQAKLVGVTSYCDYPPAAKKKTKIGGFSNPNVEKIASVNPEVVFASSGVQSNVVDSLSKLGIKVFVVDPKNFTELFSDMEKVGKIMGMEGEAKKKVAQMKAKVDEVKAKVKKLPKPTVFFEIYSQPLMTAGKDTLIDTLIKTAGGRNIGEAAGAEFPEFSPERLVAENPDVYVAIKGMGSQSTPTDIKNRPAYSGLKAVKNGRVYIVDENLFVRPGPRLIDGLLILAHDIHPEAFKK